MILMLRKDFNQFNKEIKNLLIINKTKKKELNEDKNKIIKEGITQSFIQIKKIIPNILIKSKSFIRQFPNILIKSKSFIRQFPTTHYALHRLKHIRYPEPYWLYNYNNVLDTAWSYDDRRLEDFKESIDIMFKHLTIVEDILSQNNIKFNLILLPHPTSLFLHLYMNVLLNYLKIFA